MSPTKTQLLAAANRRWSVLLGLIFVCGAAAAFADDFQAVGQNTYCLTCNVGIGTSSPSQRFHLAVGNVLLPTGNGGLAGNLYLGGVTDAGQVGMRLFGGSNATYQFAGGFIDVMTMDPGDGLRIRVDTAFGGAERMRINASGNVGIGTASPQAALDIARAMSGNFAGLQLYNYSGSPFSSADSVSIRMGRSYLQPMAELVASNSATGSFSEGYLAVATRSLEAMIERFRITNIGSVGIGTSTPGTRLTVAGADANNTLGAGTTSALRLVNADTGAVGRIVELQFGTSATSKFAALGGSLTDSANNTRGDIVIGTRNASADANLTERLRITSAGDVGIGISIPTARLHVAGNAVFSGTVTGTNIQAQYQDLAEWVPATKRITAGTVVVLDPADGRAVVASQAPYDTRVAGVVSARPGLILGEAGEGKVMVATTGRVKVRVDATEAPIRIGDLLVTSAREGIAMRSKPMIVNGVSFHRPGTLIGKALESLDTGESEILVLLSLQ